MPVQFVRSEAMLFVADVTKAAAFWKERLGFEIVFQHGEPPSYGQVRRDGAHLNLRCVETPVIDRARAAREDLLSASIVVADIDALEAEVRLRGTPLHQSLRREPWGARTLIVVDPDGNLVLFAG